MKNSDLKRVFAEAEDLTEVYDAIKGIRRVACEVCHGTGKETKSSIENDSYGSFYSPGKHCRYCYNGQQNIKTSKKERIEVLEKFISRLKNE